MKWISPCVFVRVCVFAERRGSSQPRSREPSPWWGHASGASPSWVLSGMTRENNPSALQTLLNITRNFKTPSLMGQVIKNKSLLTVVACTLCCSFVKTQKTSYRDRNIRPSQMERHKMQLRSRSFLFSFRRTLPVVHWFAVIISQTQTPPSETWINSLHRYFSAFRKLKLNSLFRLWSVWRSETLAARCSCFPLQEIIPACGSGGFVVH